MKIFFITKKLVGSMLMPLQFSLALIMFGVVLLWLNRARRLGQYLVTVGAVLLLIFSNRSVGYHLVHSLEARYPAFHLTRPIESSAAQLTPSTGGRAIAPGPAMDRNPTIVVLSGGASDDPGLPVTDRLTPDSAFRVVEAVEIYRSLAPSAGSATEASPVPAGGPHILLSGGPTVNAVPEALPMQKLALSLGVPASSILLETRSDDTASEARNALPFVGHKPFILVTSAFHMPRAMALFRHLGMRPIPAPSNYMGRRTTMPLVLKVPPNAEALVESETAWHERLGMIWEHLRGQL